MTQEQAMQADIFAVLPFDGPFLSVADITQRVAPQRPREVRAALNSLAKQGYLERNQGSWTWLTLYGRRISRRI
jgi:Mn-dependent DtxR family transcriptional regulator